MVEIPFDLPGTEKARIAMEQINASFSVTQREVIALAAKTEQGKKAFEELTAQFAKGAVSAREVREALAKVAEQAPKTAAELKHLADAAKDADDAYTKWYRGANEAREAVERYSAENRKAIEDFRRVAAAQEKAADEARKATSIWHRADEAVRGMAKSAREFWDSSSRFGEAWRNVKEPIVDVTEALARAAERTAELATEQSRFDRVQQELGVSLQRTQQYAGGFVSQTEASTAALTLQGQGIRVTQQELDALARLSMRRASDTGRDLHDVMENLVEAVTEGGEEFGKVSPTLLAVADSSHSAGERLAALVVEAGKLGPAASSAADEMDRLQEQGENAQRALAAGFAEGLAHLQMVTGQTRDARESADDLNTSLRAVGMTLAYLGSAAVNGVGAIVGVVATAIATIPALLRGAGDAFAQFTDADNLRRGVAGQRASAAFNAAMNNETLTSLTDFVEARVAAINALSDDQDATRTSATPGRAPTAGDLARNRRLRGLSNDQLEGNTRPTRPDMTFARSETGLFPAHHGQQHRARSHIKTDIDSYDELKRVIDDVREAEGRLFAQRARESDAAHDRRQREVDQLLSAEQQRMTDTKALEGQMHERENEVANQRQGAQIRRFFRDQSDSAVAWADTVRSAYQSVTEAVAESFVAWADGSLEADEALASFADSVLKTFAKIAAQQGAFELAKGLASLFFNPAEAAAHFGAATLFFAIAGGAAWASQGVMTKDERAARDKNAEESTRAPRGRELRAENDNARGGANVINVYFGGPMYGTGGVRRAAREIGGVLNSGAIQGGVQLAPAVGWG